MGRYYYGMKMRGFSIGRQPKDGFVERLDDEHCNYYDIIVYDRPLTDKELEDYELEPTEKPADFDHITIELAINKRTGVVEELSVIKGLYDHTSYLNVPCSIRGALTTIREDLEWDYK